MFLPLQKLKPRMSFEGACPLIVALEGLDGPMSGLIHDAQNVGAVGKRFRHVSRSQRVTGEEGRVESGGCGVSFDDERDGLVGEAVGGDVVTAFDGNENRACRSACCRYPFVQSSQRTQFRAAWDGDDMTGSLLIGFGSLDREKNAAV